MKILLTLIGLTGLIHGAELSLHVPPDLPQESIGIAMRLSSEIRDFGEIEVVREEVAGLAKGAYSIRAEDGLTVVRACDPEGTVQALLQIARSGAGPRTRSM